MELLSNSLRELQKRNELLSNENIKLKTRINLMNEMNETLIGIRNHLENTIKIISIQINSIDSMIPSNIDKELKKLNINYEKLKQSLERTETQIIAVSEDEEHINNNNSSLNPIQDMVINDNNVIISNITGNANINTDINSDNNSINNSTDFNVDKSVSQSEEKVEKVVQNTGFVDQNVRENNNSIEESEELLANIQISVIKTESDLHESETTEPIEQFVCELNNCGIKFNNAFKLSVHRRTHSMNEKKFRCSHNGCNFTTNHRNNYSRHLSICQKTIFKCDFEDCEEMFKKVIHLRRHKRQSHKLSATQLTAIQVTQNDSSLNTNNNVNQKSNEVRPHSKRPNKYKKQSRNYKLYRNMFGDYECYYEDCGRTFQEKIRLVYHLRTHTDERPHKCHFQGCDKGFKTPGQLNNHINVHTGAKPYKCDGECGQICEYATLSQLIHHKKRYHSGVKPFKCDYELFDCKECFVSIREMKAHKNIVHYNKRPKTMSEKSVQQKVYQMNKFPQKKVSLLNTVKSTVGTHSEQDIDLSPIEIPPLEMSPIVKLSPLRISEHQNSQRIQKPNKVNTNTENLFKCEYFGCNKAFKNAMELIRHNNSEHIQIDPIVTLYENINDIPINTTSFSNINNHFIANPMFNSTLNGNIDTNVNNSLNISVNTTYNTGLNSMFDSTLNTSTCSTRGSSLSSTYSNSSTKASQALTEQKQGFECTQCHKQYDYKSQYMIHMRKHEKPFHCLFDGCGKTFRNKEQLNVHTRTHTGEKPYTCGYIDCGKGFKTLCQLKQHLIIHTGIKPYKCDVFDCQKDFATKSQIIHHRKRNHPEVTFQPIK